MINMYRLRSSFSKPHPRKFGGPRAAEAEIGSTATEGEITLTLGSESEWAKRT